MADGNGEVKRGRKFDQVLKGARDIFMSDGFEGASVDDIARAAGVSKATLYSYFPDKRLLFMEVAKTECVRQAESAVETIDMSLPADVVLTEAAWQMVSFFTSDFGQRVFRLCVAEGISRGELIVDDIPLAADQFNELCKADLFPKLVFSLETHFDDTAKKRIVEGAVKTFLARYAA